MKQLNAQLELPALQETMVEFARQSEMLEMKQEMIDDAVDNVVDSEGIEDESDEVINQVLDELGVAMASQLADAPRAGPQTVKQSTIVSLSDEAQP